MNTTVTLKTSAIKRLRAGHPWAFRGEIAQVAGRADPGELVHLADDRGRVFGVGFYNPKTLISVRVLHRGEHLPDEAFWRGRVKAARALRERVIGQDTTTWRAIYGEADGLPGLVADWYSGHLVVQILTAGMERVWPTLQPILIEELAPRGILARNDQKVRELEGLTQGKGVLHGEVPPEIEVLENGLRFHVDPFEGQKTGAYLDQRENRLAVRTWTQGRVLDCFAYQGWFACNLAAAGAREVISVDGSAQAVERLTRNAALNGAAAVTGLKANVFDLLTEKVAAREQWDMILLDPPAFAKSRDSIEAGVRGYRDINLRAMKLLGEGGILVTSSCSYHLSEERFLTVLEEAARDAGRTFQLIERRTQGRDHPFLLGHPESYYLKTFILRVL